MHGRGNLAPNYGQVPSTSMPRQYQQPLPAQPPHLQFQQGVFGSRPPFIQQGPGSFGCQPDGHVYGQGLPGAPMGYGGVLNLPPPPPLPSARPPLQQAGGVPGFQHMLSPPPPPPLGSSTMLGGGLQPASVNPIVTLPPPPPLPYSSPPMPPSPPSSTHLAPPDVSKSPDDLSKDSGINNAPNSEMSVSISIQKFQDQNAVSHSTLFNGNGGDNEIIGTMENLGGKEPLRKGGEILKSQTFSSKRTEENQGQSDFQSALVQNETIPLPDHLIIASKSHSPADSDMEMEDDITQPDDLRFNDSLSGLYHTSDAVCSKHDMKGHLEAQQFSSECKIQEEAPSDDLKTPVAQVIKIEKNSGDLVKDGSPFRLIQGYVSDDNSENDEQNALKDVPTEVSPSVTVGNLDCKRDSEKLLSESSQSMKDQETSSDLKEDVKKIMTASVATKARYEDVPDKYKNPCESRDAYDFAVPVNDKLWKDDKKSAPASQKVDEFGRLVREGASDSEPDDKSYTRRHGKRVRSRSRSGSPVDRRRRRSPRKRRERRSRSHSRSPRHRRSRSRSPTFRRADDLRRDKGRNECFNFLKGRCYRGTSCRFMHHDPDKSERSRHHRGKQQHEEVPLRSKSSSRHEYISNISMKDSHQENDLNKRQEKGHSQDTKDDNYPLHETQHAKNSEQGGNWIASEVDKVNELQLVKADRHAASTLISDTEKSKESVGTVDHGDKKLPQDANSVDKSLPHKVSGVHTSIMMPNTQPAHGIVAPPLPKDSNLIPQPSSFPPHSTTMGSHPYMLPGQHSYVALPPTSSWTSLLLPPPPPPPYGPSMTAGVLNSTVCSQFQSSNVPSRDNIGLQPLPRPYVTDLPVYYSNSGYEQRPSIPVKDPNQSLLYGDDSTLRPPPLSNAGNQEYGHIRSGLSGQLLVQGLVPSNSAQESMSNKMQFLPDQSKPLSEPINASMLSHPYLQQQPQPYKSQYSAVESGLSIPGANDPSFSRHRPDLPTRSQPSYPLPDLGGFKISAHYNPYASTFEQPLNSRFGTNLLQQESLSRVTKPEGGDVGSSGSRQATSSPNPGKLPRSGGDQYDPLFDSIEPSANSVKKIDHTQKLEGANDSIKLSGSNKPSDVEETNLKNEVGAIPPTLSEDNEEFGETADAEVDMVENESLNSPLDTAGMADGEAEIDQVKSSSKSRKGKDSRSMKIFKVALANFVKDVLKPSWRQGNMSKEAFKTIVKKTVDKVSGAMKSHHIPKSQAKIDQYINSSQRKLTKLVMGYVDKYVKV